MADMLREAIATSDSRMAALRVELATCGMLAAVDTELERLRSAAAAAAAAVSAAVAADSKAIEEKTVHAGEDDVSIVNMHAAMLDVIPSPAPPSFSQLESTLSNVKGSHEANLCNDVDCDEDEKDGMSWTVTCGTLPSTSQLENLLPDVKESHHTKFGYDVDNDEILPIGTYRSAPVTSSVTGRSACCQRRMWSYLPAAAARSVALRSKVVESDSCMLDCPEQTHTSPMARFLMVVAVVLVHFAQVAVAE